MALNGRNNMDGSHLPEIEPSVRFAKAIQSQANVRLLLDENSEAPRILQIVPHHRSPEDRIALLLGPEGGWTEQERQAALDAGWSSCSLGHNILRAETAALSALAIVQATWHQHRDGA